MNETGNSSWKEEEMDYRQRNYYLLRISWFDYGMRLRHLKLLCPSIKIHKPYNHFINNETYDRNHYWQMMISIKKEETDSLIYELNKSTRNEKYPPKYNFIEVTKNICGQ